MRDKIDFLLKTICFYAERGRNTKFQKNLSNDGLHQTTLTAGGRITVRLVSSLTRQDLTQKENMLLFLCSEAVESKLVKLETSRTVIFPPTVSVLMLHYFIYLGMQSIIVAQC